MKSVGNHLVSIDDLELSDLNSIVSRGVEFAAGCDDRPLDGSVVGVYFRLTSTRTRTAFWTAALRLGGQVIDFGPGDLQTNTGETSDDTGRVLSRMLDVLVARTGGETGEFRNWAEQDRMSVVNAMSAAEHPTQALADLTTLRRRFGDLNGLRMVYLGEGNNTAAALALGLSRAPGVELEFRTPVGYGIAEDIMEKALASAERTGMKLTEIHDMDPPPRGFDVIYTTRWQTTGTSKPVPSWRAAFEPFKVTPELWSSNPGAAFMHDLPAHRGDEVSAEVIDGPRSIVFEQAENKMHSAMAVLEWCRCGVVDHLVPGHGGARR